MSQPPNNYNNNRGGQPQGNHRRTMGAWQPTAPTSLQMAQQNQQQQQQYNSQQQQHIQQQAHSGPYGAGPPQMTPYGYHPYYAQQPQPPPGPQRVGGWNPNYGGAPMYHQAAPPNMYYPQQQQQQQSQQQSRQQPQQALPGSQLPPQQLQQPRHQPTRAKKALVITDKDGNPIDLSGVKKSNPAAASSDKGSGKESAHASDSAPKGKASSHAGAATSSAGMDAGARMRQAALERIQGKGSEKEEKKEEASPAPAPTESKETPAPAESKETPAPAESKETPAPAESKETPAPAESKETPAPAESKETPAPAEIKETPAPAEIKETPAPTEKRPVEEKKKTGGSSLASMLAKQEKKEEKKEEEKAETEGRASNVKINGSGKKRNVYSKEEMMRLKSLPVCMVRPDDLPELTITKGPSRSDGGRGGGGGRHRGGEGKSSWQRGAPPPQRRQSAENRENAGGSNWARGQAPPPRQNNSNNRKGGRGGNDLYDGPVAPLEKSKNGWKPEKNTSPLVIAEKRIKSILNKMTKEKFDRLATQMLEIPITSLEILTLMIHNVYEKAIDEPSFGDMYGDLCVRMSQLKSSEYIKIIESDEEPPTEDGQAGGGLGESSGHTVYRWTNDVNANDSEIVGPLASVDECLEIALSDTEQARKERGEMELVIHKLLIKKGMFIKIMTKKAPEGEQQAKEEKKETEFFTVYFSVSDAKELGQQMSKIHLSERECISDGAKQNSFRRSLVNKCEDEFNKQDIYVDWKKEKKEYEESKKTMAESQRAEKEEELHFRRIKIKKQMLGNIKFIGQLYKKSLLKEKIMRFCIASLLKLKSVNENTKLPVYKDTHDNDIDEEDHEAICNMFSTIGSTIDKSPAAGFMKVCFDKITRLSQDKGLPSRSRFMYKDLMDLKANRWVPRRKVEKAKTLEEIRKDVEREEKLQAQQSAQNNYRGGRNSNYGGNNNRNNRSSTSNNNRSRQSKPATQTDDDGFTTVSGGGGKSRGSFASSNQSQRSSPQKSSKSSSSNSRSSSYAALVEEPSAATPTKKKVPEALSAEKLERRVKTIRSEYIQDPSNITELFLSLDELSGTPDAGTKFVQLNSDRIIDCKDDERAAIYSMLSTLVEKKKISSSDVKAGLADLIEFIDSYVYDAPKAFDYLGSMLTAMYNVKAVNVAWICEQAKKTEIASEENPVKIIRALAGAMEAKNGKDGMKKALSDASVSKLLGTKWEDVRSSIM